MDVKFMQLALNEGKKAYKLNEVPVGCVIVHNGKVLAKAFNQKVRKNCALYHSELLAIKCACKKIKDYRLSDCDMYVTKEPCLMCMGAIMSSRIDNLYFGAYDKKYGVANQIDSFEFNHKCNIVGGILEEECGNLLSEFFKELRNGSKNSSKRKGNQKR